MGGGDCGNNDDNGGGGGVEGRGKKKKLSAPFLTPAETKTSIKRFGVSLMRDSFFKPSLWRSGKNWACSGVRPFWDLGIFEANLYIASRP